MNALLRVRLLRRRAIRQLYQSMPPVTVKSTDAVVLGVRHALRNWRVAGCLQVIKGETK